MQPIAGPVSRLPGGSREKNAGDEEKRYEYDTKAEKSEAASARGGSGAQSGKSEDAGAHRASEIGRASCRERV